MPERSKVMTQTKTDTPVLRSRGLGVRLATAHCKNSTLLRRLKTVIPVDVKKGRPKREKGYDMRMKVGRWLEQVEEDLKKMKVRNWRENCKDRRLWNEIVKQAKTHQGL